MTALERLGKLLVYLSGGNLADEILDNRASEIIQNVSEAVSSAREWLAGSNVVTGCLKTLAEKNRITVSQVHDAIGAVVRLNRSREVLDANAQRAEQLFGADFAGRKVLVLGSGGTSLTACDVVRQAGGTPVVISRNGNTTYADLPSYTDAEYLVNTTPVGMYPNVSDSPVSLEQFPALEGVLDLIFNPARTRLLQEAKARGLVAMNGLLMLVAQAKESAEWFTGSAIEDEKISVIHQALQTKMQNIVLIGMPGCGKTSVAAELAHLTGKEVVDADAEIVAQAGMTIPEIFAKSGEAAFRRLETQVLEQLGKRSGIILSTGGGCVTRPENYPLLHQNGRIFWLKRDIAILPTDGRPISQATDLNKLFECRRPLYEAFADEIIENNGTLADAAEKILEKLL